MVGDALAAACNLPKAYKHVTWEQVCASAKTLIKSPDKAISVFERGVGFYFYGDYGRGKSALAALLLGEWASRGRPAYWIRHSEVPTAYIERPLVDALYTLDVYIETVPLLVIDEFQIRDNIRYQETQLEELIRRRADRTLPTIVTTNVSPDELGKKFPALKSILTKCMAPVFFDGVDLRKGMAVQIAKDNDVG